MAIIKVENTDITILKQNDEDYISLTDMANAKNGESRAADIIKNWIRTRFTLEFIGTWEKINNPNFKVVEFDHFKMQAGLPSFVLSGIMLTSIHFFVHRVEGIYRINKEILGQQFG
jgi:hypothetical protein